MFDSQGTSSQRYTPGPFETSRNDNPAGSDGNRVRARPGGSPLQVAHERRESECPRPSGRRGVSGVGRLKQIGDKLNRDDDYKLTGMTANAKRVWAACRHQGSSELALARLVQHMPGVPLMLPTGPCHSVHQRAAERPPTSHRPSPPYPDGPACHSLGECLGGLAGCRAVS